MISESYGTSVTAFNNVISLMRHLFHRPLPKKIRPGFQKGTREGGRATKNNRSRTWNLLITTNKDEVSLIQ